MVDGGGCCHLTTRIINSKELSFVKRNYLISTTIFQIILCLLWLAGGLWGYLLAANSHSCNESMMTSSRVHPKVVLCQSGAQQTSFIFHITQS